MLDGVLRATRDGVIIMDAVRGTDGDLNDLIVRLMNNIVERDLGRSSVQLLGRSMSSLYPRFKTTTLFDRVSDVFTTGKTQQFEYNLIHPVRRAQVWIDITLAKLQDSVVATYADITAKRELQQMAHYQSELLRGLLGSASVGIIVLDAVRPLGYSPNFRVRFINSLVEGLAGRSNHQVTDLLLTDLFPEANASGLLSRVILVNETGVTQSFEMPLGIGENLNWHRVSLAIESGRLVMALVDIHEAKQTQISFYQQTELLRSILDGSPNAIAAYDAIRNQQGEITDFKPIIQNTNNKHWLNRTDDDLARLTMLEMFTDVKEQGLFESYVQVVETGYPFVTEMAHLVNEEVAWLMFSAVKRGDGFVLTIQDKTESRKSEIALQDQTNLLQSVINASPSGIVLYEPLRNETGLITDFVYRLVNTTQLITVRKDVDECLGKGLLELFPGPQSEELFNLMVTTYEADHRKEWLLSYSSHGIHGWYKARLVRYKNSLLFTYLDVSDLKEAERQLRQQNEDLRKNNEYYQRFAHIASHDLQEPLRKIQSFGDLIGEKLSGNDTEEVKDYVSRMQAASSVMSSMVKDLLTYSKITLKKSEHTTFNLLSTIEQAIDLVQLDRQNASVDVEGNWPDIVCDQMLMRILFFELLDNAAKFIKEGTRSNVKVKYQYFSISDVESMLTTTDFNTAYPELIQSGYHVISIEDNGIGINPNYLERIFQMFQRLHPRSDYNGNGAGLAICSKIADLHRGFITVKSQLGVGSIFTVFVPA